MEGNLRSCRNLYCNKTASRGWIFRYPNSTWLRSSLSFSMTRSIIIISLSWGNWKNSPWYWKMNLTFLMIMEQILMICYWCITPLHCFWCQLAEYKISSRHRKTRDFLLILKPWRTNSKSWNMIRRTLRISWLMKEGILYMGRVARYSAMQISLTLLLQSRIIKRSSKLTTMIIGKTR